MIVNCSFRVTSFSECIGSLLLQRLRPVLRKDRLGGEAFFSSQSRARLLILFPVVDDYDVVALDHFQIRIHISGV